MDHRSSEYESDVNSRRSRQKIFFYSTTDTVPAKSISKLHMYLPLGINIHFKVEITILYNIEKIEI
jgi:hypothetical protein